MMSRCSCYQPGCQYGNDDPCSKGISSLVFSDVWIWWSKIFFVFLQGSSQCKSFNEDMDFLHWGMFNPLLNPPNGVIMELNMWLVWRQTICWQTEPNLPPYQPIQFFFIFTRVLCCSFFRFKMLMLSMIPENLSKFCYWKWGSSFNQRDATLCS